MSNFDRLARASDPGGFEFSADRLQTIYPEYFRRFFQKPLPGSQEKSRLMKFIAGNIANGDSRAAIVVSAKPFLVAAYTDELDCVAMLKFPARTHKLGEWNPGDRLLTANSYFYFDRVVSDLISGKNDTGRYQNYCPMIVDFFSESTRAIEARKRSISETEWARTQELSEEYLREKPNHARSGCPFLCEIPGTPDKLIPRRARRNSAPNFAVTKTAVKFFLEFAETNQMTAEHTVVLYADSPHPEIFSRELTILKIGPNGEQRFFFNDFGGVRIAIRKDSAYAFQNVVLGHDKTRGIMFTPMQ